MSENNISKTEEVIKSFKVVNDDVLLTAMDDKGQTVKVKSKIYKFEKHDISYYDEASIKLLLKTQSNKLAQSKEIISVYENDKTRRQAIIAMCGTSMGESKVLAILKCKLEDSETEIEKEILTEKIEHAEDNLNKLKEYYHSLNEITEDQKQDFEKRMKEVVVSVDDIKQFDSNEEYFATVNKMLYEQSLEEVKEIKPFVKLYIDALENGASEDKVTCKKIFK